MSKKHFMPGVWMLCILSSVGMAQQNPAQQKQPPQPMSFFVTSVGSGKGADLGGVAGADAHCQMLAQAAGGGSKTWHAYLSTQAANGQPAVNARDRIGAGPWYNARGQMVAKSVADLHGDTLDAARMGNNLKITIEPSLFGFSLDWESN